MEEKRYDIDVERDVFKERGNNACARFADIVEKMGLTFEKDEDNPVMKKYNELIRLVNDAYKLKTYEDIDAAEGKLTEIREYCSGLQ